MKTKKLLKKISLGVVGVASIGAIAFGVSKIVQFCKNDSKTLSLDYSVGALTDEGKYQEDECKLYTKKAFACEGLRVTFDFDAEVNGQFYFYDINDKFVSKSNIITEGTSVSVPLNGAYARAVVIPTNDDDGSISFTEKYKYGSQMQVKVCKNAESNVSQKFASYHGMLLQTVYSINDEVFKYGYYLDEDCYLIESTSHLSSATTSTLLNVEGYKSIKFDSSNFTKNDEVFSYYVFEFSEIPNDNSKVVRSSEYNDGVAHSFSKNTKYVLLEVFCSSTLTASKFDGAYNNGFTLSK